MDSGYTSLAELAEKLKTIQKASFKMVLQKKEGQWLLHTLVVDVSTNELQSRAPSYSYNYDEVAFFAGMLSGADISEWLLNKAGEINGCSFQYVLQQNVTDKNVIWARQHSNATTRFAAIEYPITLYTLPSPSNAWGLPVHILVNDNCPFFPNAQSAISQLIYGDTDPYRITDTHEAIFMRFIHTEARIKQVEISPTVLSVEVDGTNLANTRLQISGPP